MPCPLCGDICRCSSDSHSAALPRWLADDDAHLAATPPHDEPETPGADAASLSSVAEASALNHHNGKDGNQPAPEGSAVWRQEVAARLNRYQSRRKPRPPRYPSLRLRFEGEDSTRLANGGSSGSSTFPPVLLSNQALPLEQCTAEPLRPNGTGASPETPAFRVNDEPDCAGPANAASVT